MINQTLAAIGGRNVGTGLLPASDPQNAGQSHLVAGQHRRVAAGSGQGQSTRHDRRDGRRDDHRYRAAADRGQP